MANKLKRYNQTAEEIAVKSENVEGLSALLAGKVSAVAGKQLSTNDYTAADKSSVAANTSARHTHGNKSVLDKVTQALFDAWNTAVSHVSDAVRHITASERSLWNTVSGKAAENHTHTAKDILHRNGDYWAGNIGALDRSFVDTAGACRTAFLPASGVNIEYSGDGGQGWSDYGAPDAVKASLFSMPGASGPAVKITKNDVAALEHMTRITVSPVDRYAKVDKAYLWFSTSGHQVSVSIETSTVGAKTTFSSILENVPLSGWPGPNVIHLLPRTFGGSEGSTTNTYAYRFTFKLTSVNTAYEANSPVVYDIRLYGDSAWTAPNSMMKNGHLYAWDSAQNAVFPASVKASQFLEGGTALTDKYAVKSHLHTKAQISDFPVSLKNPTALTISLNGTSQGGYDGSAAKSINVTAAGVGAAASGHTHPAATQSASGFFAASDKVKLDGIAPSANYYAHPSSGVTAGIYRSVTVNAQGHVTAGANPTTLAGYGITDAAAKTHSHLYAGSSSAGGAASTAVKLATARKIAGASFDGSADISISYNNLTNKPVIPSGVQVINHLTSLSTTASLSANMGRTLNTTKMGIPSLSAAQPTGQATGDLWFEILS